MNGTENGRYAKAKVNDVGGVILFPDTYTHPDGVAAPTGVNATDEYGWEGNSYTAADWTKMESAGCVFLPAAGCRYGSEMIGLGSYGYYGSATPDGADYAYRVKFNSGSLEPANSINRCLGCSVRLVQEATSDEKPAAWDGTITAQLAAKLAYTRGDATDDLTTMTWAVGEHIAILYKVSGTKKVADAEITAVDGTTGAATITFKVEDGTPDNTACTLVYPYSAAKDDHTGVKDAATLLAAQDGTLSANLDVRVGAGTIQTTTPGLTVRHHPARSAVCYLQVHHQECQRLGYHRRDEADHHHRCAELRHHPRLGYERALCRPARRRRSGRQILCHRQRQQDLHLL